MRDCLVVDQGRANEARKRYEPPVLTELGDMAELTHFDVSVRVP